jgi:hypothetical protein
MEVVKIHQRGQQSKGVIKLLRCVTSANVGSSFTGNSADRMMTNAAMSRNVHGEKLNYERRETACW